MNATTRHYCEVHGIVEPIDVAGQVFTDDQVIYVMKSPEEATPGQGWPSGECPVCHQPTFCAEFFPT